MTMLGEMVHVFLAADNRSQTKEERLAIAHGIRDRFDIRALRPESMLEATDRMETFLTQYYPDLLEQHHEWPIHLRKGLQKASGWIELLLLTPNGWVIVDHKTFPGKEADWL